MEAMAWDGGYGHGGYGLGWRQKWPGMPGNENETNKLEVTCVRLGVDHIHYLRIQCFT